MIQIFLAMSCTNSIGTIIKKCQCTKLIFLTFKIILEAVYDKDFDVDMFLLQLLCL